MLAASTSKPIAEMVRPACFFAAALCRLSCMSPAFAPDMPRMDKQTTPAADDSHDAVGDMPNFAGAAAPPGGVVPVFLVQSFTWENTR